MDDIITPIAEATSDDSQTPSQAGEFNASAESTAPIQAQQPENAEEKRIKNALEKVEKVNEELRKTVDLQAQLVQENPDLIHRIHEADPVMANRIIAKLHGAENVQTYNQLMEKAKLDALKEKDPEAYESKKELQELKRKLEAKEQKEKEFVLQSFLQRHGVQANAFDARYKTFEAALASLNPRLIEDNFQQAVELAGRIAFGSQQVQEQTQPVFISPMAGFSGGSSLQMPKTPVDPNAQAASELFKALGFKMEGL